MKDRKCFTLVELLVVIGIIAVLAGLLLPALNSARNKSSAMECLNQVRQITAAAILWSNDNKQKMPYNNANDVYDNWDTDSSSQSWAAKLYKSTLNEPSVYICNNAYEAPGSSEPSPTDVWLTDNNSRPGLSYSVFHEISTRNTIKLDKPSHAIYVFDNNYTSSCAIAEYASKGSGDNKTKPNDSLTHSKKSNVEGKTLQKAMEEFSVVHDGKMNVGFVDGHASPFEPSDLLQKCVIYKKDGNVYLYSDYERR